MQPILVIDEPHVRAVISHWAEASKSADFRRQAESPSSTGPHLGRSDSRAGQYRDAQFDLTAVEGFVQMLTSH